MFCSGCGHNVRDGAHYCQVCGLRCQPENQASTSQEAAHEATPGTVNINAWIITREKFIIHNYNKNNNDLMTMIMVMMTNIIIN